jgi:hypothetical protein
MLDTVKSIDKINEISQITESMFMPFLNHHLDCKDAVKMLSCYYSILYVA